MIRLQPDTHRKHASAEYIGALHAFHRGKSRLHHAIQVIGNLILIEGVGVKTQIGGSELAVGSLDVDRRRLGFRRQFITHLINLGADLSERGIGVVVETQINLDRADAGAAGGFDIIDAVSTGDNAFQLRGNIASHGIRASPEIDGRDVHDGTITARILTRVEFGVGHQADHQNDDVHHERDDGLADEQVGKTFI